MSLKTLFIAWKDTAKTRAWFPVGRLDADVSADRYRFRYVAGAMQAMQRGFAEFDSFPDLHQDYRSAELFPLFANRLQNPGRPSFREFLQRLDVSADAPEAFDPIEVLAVSEGRRATDNLEVFPKVERGIDDTFAIKFFLHGWRHIHPYAAERISLLKAGEELGVSLETTNPVTGHALQIQTRDNVIIGWAPRYLLHDLVQVTFAGCGVEASVTRVNPPPAPPGQRVMICFRGCWPQNFEPMTEDVFATLVPDDNELGARELAMSTR
jgi:hypothetical protein